jgi:hypothetical protein
MMCDIFYVTQTVWQLDKLKEGGTTCQIWQVMGKGVI